MSEIYGKEYYEKYSVDDGFVDYADAEDIKSFLRSVAERIVRDLHPVTVLDAGCAMGFLVEALRDLGVEAYGIDISEYAISKVREDIRPYCVVGSLSDPFPKELPDHFDLVVSIETLEHLYEKDGEKAVHNICSACDRVLFSSTPDDFSEVTHVNVRQREYWARLFAAEGFYDDLVYRPFYITGYASMFTKDTDWLRQVEEYERNIRINDSERAEAEKNYISSLEDKDRHIDNLTVTLESEKKMALDLKVAIEDKDRHIDNLTCMLDAKEQEADILKADIKSKDSSIEALNEEIKSKDSSIEALNEEIRDKENSIDLFNKEIELKESIIDKLEENLIDAKSEHEKLDLELSHYKEHYLAAIAQREDLKHRLFEAEYAYSVISNAAAWKMTKPLRVFLDTIKKVKAFDLIIKGIKSLYHNGFALTWEKVNNKLDHIYYSKEYSKFAVFSKDELDEQRQITFPKDIVFSIVVPLYNTPIDFLEEMIDSVREQTYTKWELCLADGSDSNESEIQNKCMAYVRKDDRIRYKKLDENQGISANTNVALDIATGDYIGFLDHDDVLHPSALFEMMKAICEKDAELLYTDEATFNSPDIRDIIRINFKPDFAPDNLRANNYICHFMVCKKSLMDLTGRFRSKCDGSQDHDMVLRLSENTNKIFHIPKVLYFWRAHPESVAQEADVKPYTDISGQIAVRDHLNRIGLAGEVMASGVPHIYRIRYDLSEKPLISIIVPNYEHLEDLRTCLESIFKKSTYNNIEVIVVENNSTSDELFEYYERIQKKWTKIKVVKLEGEFNYSAINNYAVGFAGGKYLLLLNNDTEVISSGWIEEMLMLCQRNDVGAVGAKLYYPDDTIQHGGVVLGMGGVAGHPYARHPGNSPGYFGRLVYQQEMSIVTGACMMIKRSVWDEVGGLDEGFAVAFNDVDLCMKIRQKGYLIVWTPYAELYHYESKSRGIEDTPEKQERFNREVERFKERWKKELEAGDPYYNPNLTLDREDFSLSQDL